MPTKASRAVRFTCSLGHEWEALLDWDDEREGMVCPVHERCVGKRDRGIAGLEERVWPLAAIIVMLSAAVQMTWDTLYPQLPKELQDEDGRFWSAQPNTLDNTVTLTCRERPYSNDGGSHQWPISIERLRRIRV